MISIKDIYECPKCFEAITASKKPEFCPGCGHSFAEIDISNFHYPTTLFEQQEKIQNIRLLHSALNDMPFEKMMSILNDALYIVETISAKNITHDGISQVVRMSIRIGEIAKRYNDFLRSGGKHLPAVYLAISEKEKEKEESDESEKNRNGGETT